ncbi:MAG: 2-oxoacid:acceptor oxidoreductase subunit alpha, partial [Actinobacteria bacterium]|nr:2-oxoacid:acceptor oxidoreductase subunit alpha [Actinomycetota bacterium]
AIIGLELDAIEELMADAMGGDILEQNIDILRTAHDAVIEEYDAEAPDVSVPTGEHEEEQVLVSGSHAIAYGAL